MVVHDQSFRLIGGRLISDYDCIVVDCATFRINMSQDVGLVQIRSEAVVEIPKYI